MILLAPDKFKDSLTAPEVCDVITDALLQTTFSGKICAMPMADGGEGTCALLTKYGKGIFISVKTVDPLFRERVASYGLSADGNTAYIEMSAASGLSLLKSEERNPAYATTYGTGLLMADALNRHVQTILLGIGGSATNDAGIGMAAALGANFSGSDGQTLTPIGKNLSRIAFIDRSKLHARLTDTNIIALCDVDNPLYGPRGAAYVYAPQKGADDAMVLELDKGLEHYATVVKNTLSIDINFPGAGAGGGIAGGALAFFHVQYRKGVDFIMEYVAMEEQIKKSRFIITGEGKLDKQTLQGKVVQGIAALCRKHRKPFFVITGRNSLTDEDTVRLGAAAVVSLVDAQTSETQAMKDVRTLMKRRIQENIIPLLNDGAA
jgi:glycerate kinase